MANPTPNDRDRATDEHDEHRHSEPLGAPVDSRQSGNVQHDRKGQAESPKQTNHFEPPRHKEGHK